MEIFDESQMTMGDFYKIFNVFNRVLTLFGLSSLQPFYENNKMEYKLSYKCVVYSTAISALIIYVFYLQVTEFFPEADSLILLLLYLYLTFVGTIMSILMILTAVLNANNYAELINDSEYFEIFTLMRSYRILKWASAKQLFLSFSILTICYLWDFTSSEVPNLFGRAITILMFFLFPIYNSLCISQFYITLFWLGQLYKTINDDLIRMMAKSNSDLVTNISIIPSYIVFGISEMIKSYEGSSQRISRNSEVQAIELQPTKNKEICIRNLQRLRKQCHKTYKLTSKLNSIFSSRNMLLVLHHCALGTVYLYWAIRHSFPTLLIPLTGVINMYRCSIMSFVSIMWLIWPSTILMEEIKRTGALVHELLAETEHPDTEAELQLFSLQLLQEPISFAPHGFFNLSYSALLSMLGAVTSYLVILLQYHVMYMELQSMRNNSNINNSSSTHAN